MNDTERAVAYRIALAGQGRDEEVALARVCADLPPGLADRAETAWEGALLAEVTPWKLRAVIDAEDWPLVATLADLAGEASWSKVVRYNRDQWAKWSPPDPERT
jgi:hypothetical protein